MQAGLLTAEIGKPAIGAIQNVIKALPATRFDTATINTMNELLAVAKKGDQ